MRVVTLLPAATEIVAALGAGARLVGISHECDFPPWLQHLPRVTATPIDIRHPGARIDARVRELREQGRPVIGLEAHTLRRLVPELVITQSLCEVCAVSDGEVHRLSQVLSPAPRVLSLEARDLAGIWTDIRTVGRALDLEDDAEELILGLVSRLERLGPMGGARRSQAHGVSRVLCIEWLDPLYLAGHWVPDLVQAAGAEDVGAEPGYPSARRSWDDLGPLRPDLILVMLCGFGVDRVRQELELLRDPVALHLLGRVPTWILDGNAYTSRPGPRVVEGAERIRAALAGREMEGLCRWTPAT